MSWQTLSTSRPMVTVGDQAGERPEVIGVLVGIRNSTKFENNWLYDIDTVDGPITVTGCAALKPLDAHVGETLRLRFAGWGAMKNGQRVRRITIDFWREDAAAPPDTPAGQAGVPVPDAVPEDEGDEADVRPY